MTNNEKQILNDAYNLYRTGQRGASISFKDTSPVERQTILNKLNYLEEKGLIDVVARAIGFIEFRITALGIDFVENDFTTATISPVVQGNNSVYISGSNNTVTDNYNEVKLEINNSNLPDETKRLIENFLHEIKNSNISKESKAEKIKQFLSDITSGTLSGLATNGLTVLLSSVFSKF